MLAFVWMDVDALPSLHHPSPTSVRLSSLRHVPTSRLLEPSSHFFQHCDIGLNYVSGSPVVRVYSRMRNHDLASFRLKGKSCASRAKSVCVVSGYLASSKALAFQSDSCSVKTERLTPDLRALAAMKPQRSIASTLHTICTRSGGFLPRHQPSMQGFAVATCH